MPVLRIDGRGLDIESKAPLRGDAPTLVFLHEGLGTRRLWRDFPSRLRQATGCGTVTYSRWGYGDSDPRPGPWPDTFIEDEADTLKRVLDATGATRAPILFGHSDGGSIALIFAARYPDVPVGVITEAAHVIVEDVTAAGIVAMRQRYAAGALRERLERQHRDRTDDLFESWTGAWSRPAFRQWDVRPQLATLRCPVLAIQGVDDEFGTMAQLDDIEAWSGGPVTQLRIPGCGHAPHSQQPAAVLDAAIPFVMHLMDASFAPASSAPLS